MKVLSIKSVEQLTPCLEFKPCRCGSRLVATSAGWCCESCNRRLLPYLPGEIIARRAELEEIKACGECPDCICSGKELCVECDGTGVSKCCECGHNRDCKECDGVGSTVCSRCEGVVLL